MNNQFLTQIVELEERLPALPPMVPQYPASSSRHRYFANIMMVGGAYLLIIHSAQESWEKMLLNNMEVL